MHCVSALLCTSCCAVYRLHASAYGKLSQLFLLLLWLLAQVVDVDYSILPFSYGERVHAWCFLG